MRLLRIALTDFRGVEASEVDFAAPGITVVVGPNEIGKSSLAEALELIRGYKSSSQAAPIKAVQPTHRDVGPQVEIEVETGDHRFVYTKRWLRKHLTELRITSPKAEQLTGDEAHDRVEKIFADTLDPQLWDALRQAQGDSLQQAQLAKVGPLQTALSAAAESADGAGDAHADLMARIELRHREFFTPTGKPTNDYAKALETVARLTDEVTEAEARLRGVAERVERHASLTRQRDRLVQHASSSAADLDDHEARFASIAVLRTTAEAALGRLREAELAAAAARTAVSSRAEREAEVTERRDEAVAAAARLKAADEAHTAYSTDESEREAEREAARTRLDEARTVLRSAASAAEAARARTELQALAERLDTAAAASARLEEIATALAANPVDSSALQRLTDAHAAAQTARAASSSGAARISVRRLGTAEVSMDGAAVDREASVDVTNETTVEVPGVVRVVVTADASAAERHAEVEHAERELGQLFEAFGVVDLAAARDRAAERDQLRGQQERSEAELAAALAGETIESLRGRRAALAETADHGGSEAESVEAGLEAAQASHEAAAAALEVVTVEREARVVRGNELRAALIRAQAQFDSLDDAAARLQIRLETERTELGDEALTVALVDAEAELEAATDAAAEARAALDAQDADALEAILANARDLRGKHAEELSRLGRELAMVEGELEALGRDGLQDAADLARSRLEDAARTRDSLHARAQASRLLFTTMSAHQLAARQRYVEPFRMSIGALGKVVFGTDFDVEIDDDLVIVSRTCEGVTVPFDSLSGGAKEQLALIGRLATARLVSADDGAPVILDDSLGFTDADRRGRLAAVLNLVGSTSQIIILTCEPERFADISSARTVTLP